MKDNARPTFTGLDLGTTKPTSVPMETVEVEITTESLMGDFAKAFVNEAYRVNPLKAEQVKLTKEELISYCDYLVDKRIECVDQECNDWRKLKNLYIPTFIQFALSMIGEVKIREKGLTFKPVKDAKKKSKLTYEDALAISEKVGSFEDDLQIVQDAMPRSTDGDKDVMTSALIAGYVRSIEPVGHVISTYVAAFMGLKLREEMSFKVLYRVQYDDLQFIASTLATQKGLF